MAGIVKAVLVSAVIASLSGLFAADTGKEEVEATGVISMLSRNQIELKCEPPDACANGTLKLKVGRRTDLGGVSLTGLAGHKARLRYMPKGDGGGRLVAFLGFDLPETVVAEGTVVKAAAIEIVFRCAQSYPCAGRSQRLAMDESTEMHGLEVEEMAGLAVAIRYKPDQKSPDEGRVLSIARLVLPEIQEVRGKVTRVGGNFLELECDKDQPCKDGKLQLTVVDQKSLKYYSLDSLSEREITLRFDPKTRQVRELVGTFADDLRGDFEATFYTGVAIDTFAVNDRGLYRNPEESGDVRERGVAGFDFAYRLWGDPKDRQQLWVLGETVHGMRSTEVDCKESPDNPVCTGPSATSSGAALQIIRNATSLEGFLGLRYEFNRMNTAGPSAARPYLKAQAGFISIAGDAKDAIDVNFLGIGAICTKGRLKGSFLDLGVGTSHYFIEKPYGRYKLDALLTWTPRALDKYLDASPFAELTVDADLGDGPDSIQTYIGFDFDLDRLFGGDIPAKEKNNEE